MDNYKALETALREGHRVQTCSVDHKGRAMEWQDVSEINRAFDPSRYRIIESTGRVIDRHLDRQRLEAYHKKMILWIAAHGLTHRAVEIFYHINLKL